MSFTKLGVVIPLGSSGQFDDYYIFAPAALERNGEVWIYYAGWRYDGRDRIGLAVSKDGAHFTKLGVVLSAGASGEFDDVDVFYPTVLERDGFIYLYYTGYDGSRLYIGLAVSEDGIHFNKLGTVIPLGAAGDFDDYTVGYPAALEHDGSILLYYTGNDGSRNRIGLALSEDGVHFKKLGIVIPLGAGGDFDEIQVWYPAVLKHSGQIWMYYVGRGGPTPPLYMNRLGLAVSKDGINFVHQGVVFLVGDSGDFDNGSVTHPAALRHDGRVWMYYGGYDGSNYRIGLAISEDGL